MKTQLEQLAEAMIALTVQMLQASLTHLIQAHLNPPQAAAPISTDGK